MPVNSNGKKALQDAKILYNRNIKLVYPRRYTYKKFLPISLRQEFFIAIFCTAEALFYISSSISIRYSFP